MMARESSTDGDAGIEAKMTDYSDSKVLEAGLDPHSELECLYGLANVLSEPGLPAEVIEEQVRALFDQAFIGWPDAWVNVRLSGAGPESNGSSKARPCKTVPIEALGVRYGVIEFGYKGSVGSDRGIPQSVERLTSSAAKQLSGYLARSAARDEFHSVLDHLEAAARGAADGFWDWNLHTNAMWYTPRLKQMLGYEFDEFPDAYSTFLEHLHPDDRQRVMAEIETHFGEDTAYDMTYRLRTKSGDYRWFRARGECLRDEFGKPHRMSGSLRDVTEKVEAMAEAEQTSAALKERVKELGCLYRTARLFGHGQRSDKELFREFVNYLPSSLQFPELAAARLLVAGAEYKSENYVDSPWSISAPIMFNRNFLGILQVVYVEKPEEAGEHVWLTEEYHLLDGLSQLVAGYLDRKASEDELVESERFARGVVDALTAHIVIVDETGTIVDTNAAWNEFAAASGLSGAPEFSGIGSNYLDVCCQAEGPAAQCAKDCAAGLEAVIRGETHEFVMEYPCVSQGQELWFTVRITPFAGDSPGRYVIAHEDNTSRKKAESEARLLHHAFEQADEGILITDDCRVVQYVNAGFERLTGYSRDEVIGNTPDLLNCATDDCALRAAWESAAEQRVWHGELCDRRKDGSPLHTEATISPIRDERGNITQYIVSVRDVTAQRDLESKLQQAQKMEAIGQLAGGVAHDFNNVLTAIKGYAEFALAELPEEFSARRDVDSITKAADSAASLTRQLLAFARQQAMQPELINLNDIAHEMLTMLMRLLRDDIELIADLAPNLGRVKADPSQIEQILLNLAVNARDAMPNGGRLCVSTANVDVDETSAPPAEGLKAGRYVRLTVADTGEGMSPEVAERVFEPFYTTKAKGKGTGLGLSTIYGIVKQNGGAVWVESEAGQGSSFHICLPCAVETVEAVKDPAETESAPEAEPARATGTATIFVVDDCDAIRTLAEKVLKSKGYHVYAATRGDEAVEMLDTLDENVDLLLTDIVLPEVSGPELAARYGESMPNLKILFMSGFSGDISNEFGIKQQDVQMLEKPFTPSQLCERIEKILGAPGAF